MRATPARAPTSSGSAAASTASCAHTRRPGMAASATRRSTRFSPPNGPPSANDWPLACADLALTKARRLPMMNRAKEITWFLLRVVSGLLFFQAGSTKFLGWFGGIPGGRPPLLSQIGIGGMLEFFGGIAIMLGVCTLPVAFILAGEMAVAYWQFHFP